MARRGGTPRHSEAGRVPPESRRGEGERGGLYGIAVAARLTGMHPQTLRKYERAGLLTPERLSGNQRLYSDADVERLLRIRYLVDVRGINLAGLELALAMSDRLDELTPQSSHADVMTAIDETGDMTREPS